MSDGDLCRLNDALSNVGPFIKTLGLSLRAEAVEWLPLPSTLHACSLRSTHGRLPLPLPTPQSPPRFAEEAEVKSEVHGLMNMFTCSLEQALELAYHFKGDCNAAGEAYATLLTQPGGGASHDASHEAARMDQYLMQLRRGDGGRAAYWRRVERGRSSRATPSPRGLRQMK